MRIVLAGSTGYIGSHLLQFLQSMGHEVIPLMRHTHEWNPDTHVIDPEMLEGADVVCNFVGESIIEGRWSRAKKKRIVESRVIPTELLIGAINQLKTPPKVFISASAAGFYGSRGDAIVTEETSSGSGFLAEVCLGWEAPFVVLNPAVRAVVMRLGVVLSTDGGMIKKLLPIFRLGLGGKIGDGTQWMSWIALDDVVRLVDFAITNAFLQGPVNAVSPNPVTNSEFTKALAHVLHRPAFCAIPKWVVKTVFREKGEELLLSSIRAIPQKAEEAGFDFRYPDLASFLSEKLS